ADLGGVDFRVDVDDQVSCPVLVGVQVGLGNMHLDSPWDLGWLVCGSHDAGSVVSCGCGRSVCSGYNVGGEVERMRHRPRQPDLQPQRSACLWDCGGWLVQRS